MSEKRLHRRKNLEGMKFGRLTALRPGEDVDKRTTWICSCECGTTEKLVKSIYLTTGQIKSCGCLHSCKTSLNHKNGKNHPAFGRSKSEIRDISNKKFGRLKPIKVVGEIELSARSSGKPKLSKVWLCRCDCGALVDVARCYLTRGSTTSCGCRHLETRQKSGSQNISYKHGGTGKSLFTRWQLIKSRCFCPTSKGYQWYGAKGISMYEGWVNDYKAFEDYCYSLHEDLDERIAAGFEIDRTNVLGNYEPGNIRFISQKENMRNQRSTRYIVFKDRSMPLTQFVEEATKGLNNMTYEEACKIFSSALVDYVETVQPFKDI